MTATIKETPVLDAKSGILSRAIDIFSAACAKAPAEAWQYEAHVEARTLFILVIRHIEAVCQLASTDLSLLPTAIVAGRAAFEGSVRAAWLVHPPHPLDREMRFVAHLGGEVDYLKKQQKMSRSISGNADTVEARALQISEFRIALTAELAKHGWTDIPRVPDFRSCLVAIGEERAYPMYSWLSQYMHSTHASTWLYREGGLGTARRFDDTPRLDHWDAVFNICRFAMLKPAATFLRSVDADASTLEALLA